MRGIVVGEFAADFQPGSQFAGSGNLLVHRRWLAARDGTISRRRNRVYVGHARADLGAAAFQLSHRSSPGAALGHSEDWLRPPCSGIAGRDCRGAFCRLAVFAIGVQYELCVSRSSLSSLLGACSRAPRGDVFWGSRASLLADPSFFELDVPGRERRQVKCCGGEVRNRKEMATDSDKNREKYLAMLKTAVEEARLGLSEGGIPIGAALFERNGKLLGSGHNRRVQEGDPSAHGETDAFRKAGRQRSYRDKIMVTTLAPCWYCSGLIRQFGIGAVVVGESVNFRGGIDWLRENGTEVFDAHSNECVQMLAKYIADHLEIWNEDIGVD